MARAVLISIRPEWVEKILSGEKTLEVRKTRPKLETPFKVYIYCTNQKNIMLWNARSYIYVDDHNHNAFDRCWNGSVVGEFVCDRIDTINPETEPYGIYDVVDDVVVQTRLVDGALWEYGKGATLYGWHISNLEIYDTPKPLSAFKGRCKIEADCGCCPYYNYTKMDCDGRTIKRPPQSWCYVEQLNNVCCNKPFYKSVKWKLGNSFGWWRVPYCPHCKRKLGLIAGEQKQDECPMCHKQLDWSDNNG